MTVTIRRLSPQEFALNAPELVDIYLTAMGYDASIRANRIRAWRREIMHPGFAAVIAENDSGIVGLAYGFLGTPDAWWDRQLRRAFEQGDGVTPKQLDMLHNYFELAEIHVHPRFQGHGIGGKLIYALLWPTPSKFVLLSTPEVAGEDNSAFGLYRSLGFFDVLRNHLYPGDDRKFAVLAAELPLPNRYRRQV